VLNRGTKVLNRGIEDVLKKYRYCNLINLIFNNMILNRNGDGQGPNGRGPRTGRGRGPCK